MANLSLARLSYPAGWRRAPSRSHTLDFVQARSSEPIGPPNKPPRDSCAGRSSSQSGRVQFADVLQHYQMRNQGAANLFILIKYACTGTSRHVSYSIRIIPMFGELRISKWCASNISENESLCRATDAAAAICCTKAVFANNKTLTGGSPVLGIFRS